MLKKLLKPIIAEKKETLPNTVILNFLKEYIQYLTLSFIYNHKQFKNFVFKGGSCLRICFQLPRLSEDLDFDYQKSKFPPSPLKNLELYLAEEIKKKYYQDLETKEQEERRIYLKFPFLYELGLAQKPESNKLYVKIETSDSIPESAETELTPISKFGFNIVVRHYNLPSLMAGKINALLNRVWFKGEKQQIDIKGRDFYDLYWFLKNDVQPNMAMLKKMTGIKNKKELKRILKERVKKTVTPQKLNYDLKNFISDQEFTKDFSKNYLEIIEKQLDAL